MSIPIKHLSVLNKLETFASGYDGKMSRRIITFRLISLENDQMRIPSDRGEWQICQIIIPLFLHAQN